MNTPKRDRGFTLIEIIVAATIAIIVVLGATAILMMSLKSAYKTTDADAAVRGTRKFRRIICPGNFFRGFKKPPIRIILIP